MLLDEVFELKEGASFEESFLLGIDFMAGIQVKSNGDWAKNRQSHLCYSAPLGSQCESAQYSPSIILHMHIALKEKSLKSDFQK